MPLWRNGSNKSVPTSIRGNRYGEMYVQAAAPVSHAIADGGGYFVATNPTIGVTTSYATITAFSNTAALFLLYNPPNSGVRTYLHRITMLSIAGGYFFTPGANKPFQQIAVQVDKSPRTPTANSVHLSPVNVNMDDMTGAQTQVWAYSAGSLTIPDPVAPVTVCRASVPDNGDANLTVQYICGTSGLKDACQGAISFLGGDEIGHYRTTIAPVMLGPGQSAAVHVWFPALDSFTPVYEYELSWWER